MPLNKKGKKIKRAMTKQYGKKKGKKVFYAMENSGKLRKVTKAKGGMDASQPDFGGGTPGPGDTGGEGGYTPQSTSQFGQEGSSPSSTGGPNKVEVRKGPIEINMPQSLRYLFPTTSAAIYGFNKLSKSLYNQRNLREQRKKDVLGGEMLTTRKPKTITDQDRGDGETRMVSKPIIPGPVAINQPILPLSQRKTVSVSPTGRFNYALKKGGILIKGKPKLTKKGWK